VTLPPSATVGEAIQAMLTHEIGALLIVAEGRLLGILSERDLLLKVAGHDEALAAPASAYMTADPETVRGSDTLAFALHKMDCGGYRHLVVLREGQPPDMISVRDMILHITRLCRNGG
jgi:CBS domain-containing protein